MNVLTMLDCWSSFNDQQPRTRKISKVSRDMLMPLSVRHTIRRQPLEGTQANGFDSLERCRCAETRTASPCEVQEISHKRRRGWLNWTELVATAVLRSSPLAYPSYRLMHTSTLSLFGAWQSTGNG